MKKRYNILSPDGFPISPEDFQTVKEARQYLKKWIDNYKQQGYYSQTCYNGYRREIPLNQIADYCELITL